MFTTVIEDYTFHVEFRHHRRHLPRAVSAVTTATVVAINNTDATAQPEIYTGLAVCTAADQFSRSYGRLLALYRICHTQGFLTEAADRTYGSLLMEEYVTRLDRVDVLSAVEQADGTGC